MRYKGPLSRIALGAFVVAFLGLLIVGGMEVSALSISLARIFSVLYFGYFLLMPIYTSLDTHKTPPTRLTL
jgi:ubiquinol-cytochrome c reductase cytochrome b subunit